MDSGSSSQTLLLKTNLIILQGLVLSKLITFRKLYPYVIILSHSKIKHILGRVILIYIYLIAQQHLLYIFKFLAKVLDIHILNEQQS